MTVILIHKQCPKFGTNKQNINNDNGNPRLLLVKLTEPSYHKACGCIYMLISTSKCEGSGKGRMREPMHFLAVDCKYESLM